MAQIKADMQRVLAQLASNLKVLERVGCQFPMACPGPDQPHEDMATCYVCEEIRETRALLARVNS